MRTCWKIILLFAISAPAWCAAPDTQVTLRTVKVPVVDGSGIRFTAISTSDGLSQTRVTNIVQDDLGFLWFGTQYGLNRFDGYSFKVFLHQAGDKQSPSGVNVAALFKDRDGDLWIGSERFLDRMDPKQATVSHYPIPAAKHISQDKKGLLWVSTSSGLYRLDPRNNEVWGEPHR